MIDQSRKNSIRDEISKIQPQISSLECAKEMHNLGIKVVPLKPENNQEYDPKRNAFSDKFPIENFPELFAGQNIGVVLGPASKNLFMIACSSEYSFEYICRNKEKYIKWVSADRNYYYIWLFCKDGWFRTRYRSDGSISKFQFRGVSFITEGTQVAPPSLSHNGDYSFWYVKEGDAPASISEIFLGKYFPGIERYINQIQNPTTYSPGFNRPLRTPVARYLVEWANNHNWKGHTGISNRNIFTACIRRADLECVDDFRGSLREIAEEANTTKDTARKSLTRLCKIGLLKRIKKSETGNRYAITVDISDFAEGEYPFDKYAIGLYSYQNHDVFSRSGCGSSAAVVLDELYRGPQRFRANIARKTGLSPNTVKKNIGCLEKADIIHKVLGKWLPKNDVANGLDEFAENQGINGRYLMKKERHKRERAAYHARVTMKKIDQNKQL